MVTVIKKGTPVDDQVKQLNKIVKKSNVGLQTKRYSGKLTTPIDPLTYQKNSRNEWE